MAQALAPYNNAMRLGQGFNSYTQQICLDRAVGRDPEQKAPPSQEEVILHKAAAVSSTDLQKIGDGAVEDRSDMIVYPWVKPQIVTYSSRFVDKLSDVTDAMNISGSLSIKTSMIGGKASGSYIDSDKFKSSDINFHLQVRVTNQIHDAADYSKFNEITLREGTNFAEVYGDSFISGWEEGGELNAILSIKVHDKNKTFQIKAEIEAEMSTAAIAGKIEAKADIEKSNLSSETETTIAVNWSGGGSIKDPTDDWDIASLKKAAAAFPELVAITPQRTFAILTRYTALASFHTASQVFNPLDYENAGIYTGALLDSYMDYKALWKQISSACVELEANRATIERGEPSKKVCDLANLVEYLPPASEKGSNQGNINQIPATERKQRKLEPFEPTFVGLIEARRVCRTEMANIVREVDIVAKAPTVANDITRDDQFLHPLVFKQLLPLVRSLSEEDAKLGVKDPSAALLLGYQQPKVDERNLPQIYELDEALGKYDSRLRKEFRAVGYKAGSYRMRGCAGPYKDASVDDEADLFNDARELDQLHRPVVFSIWMTNGVLTGLEVKHVANQKCCHGSAKEKYRAEPSHQITLGEEGTEIVTEVMIREVVSSKGSSTVSTITGIVLATSSGRLLDSDITQDPNSIKESEDKKENELELTKEEKEALDKEVADKTDEEKMDALKKRKKEKAEAKQQEENKAKEEAEEKRKAAEAKIKKPEGKLQTTVWTPPDDPRGSLRGFFGFTYEGRVSTLGAVWGFDNFVPILNKPIQGALCKNIIGLSSELRRNIATHTATLAGKFYMGGSVLAVEPGSDSESGGNARTPSGSSSDDSAPKPSSGYFNAVGDIEPNWTIKTIRFACNESEKLCGLQVLYNNGKEYTYGKFEKQRWSSEVRSSLAIVKVTAGHIEEHNKPYVDTVEFVRGGGKGPRGLPPWPMEVSTMRFLTPGGKRVDKDVQEIVERAPTRSNAAWNIRGFYGEYSDEYITRLGVIWGYM